MKNLVVIGFGGMGAWHVRHALTKYEETGLYSNCVNLLGVYDILPSRRQAAKDMGVYAYETLEDVLNDDHVDICTVAIPNDAHKEVCIRCLNAGKNVICEKPVTLTSNDLEEMISCAKKNKKIFSVHQNRRFDTDYLLAKSLYEGNDLGRIFCIESRVHGSHGIPGDWRTEKEHGGGMVYDWGVHMIDQALQMIPSKIKEVYCTLDNITNEIVDDGCKIDITFENGVLYRVEIGTSNFISLPRFYIKGINGTAVIKSWGSPAEVVCCKNWTDKDVVPVITAAGLTKTMAPRNENTITKYEVPQTKSDVHDYYRNFCMAIDGKCTQIVTHDEMRRVLKVIEAAFESSEKHEVIKRVI